MRRVQEFKPLPGIVPVAPHQLHNFDLSSIREVGDVLEVCMASPDEFHQEQPTKHGSFLREEFIHSKPVRPQNFASAIPVTASKGKESLLELEKFMSNAVTCKSSSIGSTSFHGASHPPEPIDMDLMKPVFVPVGRTKSETGTLMKSLSVKGEFHIPDATMKPNLSFISNMENMVEDPDEVDAFSYSFTVPPTSSQRMNNNIPIPVPTPIRPLDSDEKEIVWDTSLPPSSNVSPHSSIDSGGVFTAMSIVNSSTSTNKSDALPNDGMLNIGRNCESSKTSVSRVSDSSGLSDDSNWSNLTSSINKPHKGSDPRWNAILAVRSRDGNLGMSHFRLLRRLGCGDIGTVYLSELSGTRCYFAMKVMDKESLSVRKKLVRAQTEREILQLLDHPFLPTLYTHFETDRFLCLVMEFCPGGDLHTLRQRQPGKHFSEYAARFYAAEVLLALEYLHMLGVVYRDLKPENVLVREDGHIMLSDFDLSLRCSVSPTLIKVSGHDSGKPFCIQPSCTEPFQPSCFLPRLLSFSQKGKKSKTPRPLPANSSMELLAEPTSARSMSFVGTHEYLAPEIIKGDGHGSAVDWWTFGIFIHELLYGKTPFKGSGNRQTLFNVVGQQLMFPESPSTSAASRDLIQNLLAKEPQNRLGVKRGATEIKQHPFFEGVNWALIRCSTPPEVPRPVEMEQPPRTVGQGGVAVESGGVGSVSKRVAGTEMKPGGGRPYPGSAAGSGGGGNFLDFEFF